MQARQKGWASMQASCLCSAEQRYCWGTLTPGSQPQLPFLLSPHALHSSNLAAVKFLTRSLPCCRACRSVDGRAKPPSPAIKLDSHRTEVIVAIHVKRATVRVRPRCLAMSGRAAQYHAIKHYGNSKPKIDFFIMMLSALTSFLTYIAALNL